MGHVQKRQNNLPDSDRPCVACLCRYLRKNSREQALYPNSCLSGVPCIWRNRMIDRISLHYVVDFFDFRLINFPIFNVADIYVTVSMIVLILLCAFYYHDHEIDVLFSKSKKD